MRLYEIEDELRALLDNVIDEDGVIDESKLTEISALEKQKDEKILGWGKFLKEKMAEIQAMKEAEGSIRDRRKVLENLVTESKKHLLQMMGDTVEDSYIRVSTRKSSRLIIEDTNKFIDEHVGELFISAETTFKIDKDEIKKKIKGGDDISGAHIAEYNNLAIK